MGFEHRGEEKEDEEAEEEEEREEKTVAKERIGIYGHIILLGILVNFQYLPVYARWHNFIPLCPLYITLLLGDIYLTC